MCEKIMELMEPDELKEPEQLVFEWTWGEDEHRIDYEIELDTAELYRNRTISGSLEEKRVQAAQFIDTNMIDWKVSADDSGDRTVKITVAASISGNETAGETRIINLVPGLNP